MVNHNDSRTAIITTDSIKQNLSRFVDEVKRFKANDTPFLVGHSGMEMDDNMAKEKGKSITDRWESEKFKPTGRK